MYETLPGGMNSARMTDPGPRLAGNGDRDVERQIPQELSRLREAVQVQRKMLEELGARLSPIMPNVPHAENCAKDGPRPQLSPLGEDIRSLAAAVGQSNEIIHSFLGRIEV